MPSKKPEYEISPLELKKGKKAQQNLSRKVVHQKGQALVGIPKSIFDKVCRIMSGEIYVDWEEASNPFAAEVHIRFHSGSSTIDQKKNSDCKSQSKNQP